MNWEFSDLDDDAVRINTEFGRFDIRWSQADGELEIYVGDGRIVIGVTRQWSRSSSIRCKKQNYRSKRELLISTG